MKFLIVGAGSIALSKLEAVLEFVDSKQILVLSKKITSQNRRFLDENRVALLEDSYAEKYLCEVDLVIAATDDLAVNASVSRDARRLGKLVNVVDDPKNSDFIFGANVKNGEVAVSVGTSGVAPVLARLLKQKIKAVLPQNLTGLSDFLAQNKDLVREKLPNLQARRLFLQDAIEGVIGEEVLIGNVVKAQGLLESGLENCNDGASGAVYFISAGPGDPELVTLKAIRLLSKADVVLFDRLVASEILGYARKDALKINVGKRRDFHRHSQFEINEMLRKYVLEGKVVARLKGGDAAIFARLSEEIDAIVDLGVPYQIVPGVTAASGAAACAGIPLTSRDSNKSVRFLTLYKDDLVNFDYWRELAKSGDSLVFYMSSHNLLRVAAGLIVAGKSKKTPLAVIEQATTPFQKVFLSELGKVEEDFFGQEFVSPSLLIVGEIVLQHEKYGWQENERAGSFFSS